MPMPMPIRLICLLCLSSLLFFSLLSTPVLSIVLYNDEVDEEFLFLVAQEEKELASKSSPYPKFTEAAYDDDFEVPSDIDSDDDDYDYEEALYPGVDDKDVVVLTEGNFADFIETNKFVFVKFYGPWCGHCKAMAPEYAAAATELKGWDNKKVHQAKVRATLESDLADKYNVVEYPTFYFFIDGQYKPYPGQTSKHAIVSWIKKKIGPGVENINTIQDAERILTAEEIVVLGFLNSLVGPESEELAAASKVHDDVNFYQTVNPGIAKLFHLEPNRRCPSLVLLKKVAEKVTIFDGEFTNQKIAEFVFANKLPLVTTVTQETAQKIIESPIKKQVLLFTTSSDSVKLVSTFQEAAKLFQGNVFGYTRDDNQKYKFDGEITLENFKVFGADFVEDKIKPFYRSDPIPETNAGDVKIVVGKNFEEIVLDEPKDVLLEIYTPCGFSQAFEPIYNKFAKHLHGSESLVLAKMDGTTNEHPGAKDTGYPTLLFFPAGKKSSDPIPVDAGRTLVELYNFIKKHASIPFKLQKGTYSDLIKDEL